MRNRSRLRAPGITRLFGLFAFGLVALGLSSPAQAQGCEAHDSRGNRKSPLIRGYDFVPIIPGDALGFYVVYSERTPPKSSNSDAEVYNTSGIFVFELGPKEILIFGAGYGNHGVATNDAQHDADRVADIVEGCMGFTAAGTLVHFAVPHGHTDHVNSAFLKKLGERGFAIAEIVFHNGDRNLVRGAGNWTPELLAVFNSFRGGTPDHGFTCGEELLTYSSPLGKIWFVWRGNHHTKGSIDLVLDVQNDPEDRILVRGSQAGGTCSAAPSGTRLKLKAHGNAVVPDDPTGGGGGGGGDPEPPDASVVSYGCGVNPDGSLTVLSGTPSLGGSMTFGVTNPLQTQRAGALPLVLFSWTPDRNYPCGTLVADRSMREAGKVGERLIQVDPKPFEAVFGAAWKGGHDYAPLDFQVPGDTALIGTKFYAQGRLLDLDNPVFIAFTNALEIEIGL